MAKKLTTPTKLKEPTYIFVDLSNGTYLVNQTKNDIQEYVDENGEDDYLVIDKNNIIYEPYIDKTLKLVVKTK